MKSRGLSGRWKGKIFGHSGNVKRGEKTGWHATKIPGWNLHNTRLSSRGHRGSPEQRSFPKRPQFQLALVNSIYSFSQLTVDVVLTSMYVCVCIFMPTRSPALPIISLFLPRSARLIAEAARGTEKVKWLCSILSSPSRLSNMYAGRSGEGGAAGNCRIITKLLKPSCIYGYACWNWHVFTSLYAIRLWFTSFFIFPSDCASVQ